MKVLKFGGTSVGKPERMKQIVNIVTDDSQKIIVLSALAGTTNQLEELCQLLYNKAKDEARNKISLLENYYEEFIAKLFTGLSSNTKDELTRSIKAHFKHMRDFTLDMFTSNEEKALLAQGELMSTTIFHAYANEIGTKAAFINALDFMRTDKDGEPDLYYIKHNLQREISELGGQQLIITQGYICRNVFGEIDNLKRGGSDYSASLIGEAIQAERIEIWTDIDGMHNNDPRVVDNTKPIRQLSFNEAAELAYFGAKILHPSSIRPAQQQNIPVILKNTLNPTDAGTFISAKSNEEKIKAIAAKDNITAIKIKSGRMLLAHGFLRKVFEVFERYQTSIDMITTSEVAVSLTIDDNKKLSEITEELSLYGTVEVDKGQTIVCIVGDFLAESKGHADLVFQALKNIPIRMISYGGSKNNISILIEQSYKNEALNALNNKLFA